MVEIKFSRNLTQVVIKNSSKIRGITGFIFAENFKSFEICTILLLNPKTKLKIDLFLTKKLNYLRAKKTRPSTTTTNRECAKNV